MGGTDHRAVPGRTPRQDRRHPRGARYGGPRAHRDPRRLQPESQARPPPRCAQGDVRDRRGGRLGYRRGAGLRDDPCRGLHGAAQRPGLPARDLFAAPLGADRPADPGSLYAARPHMRGPGANRRARQPAGRGLGAGLRVRHVARRSQDAGAVGGAVRRFRQRRPVHHRPVHLFRRDQVAAHVRAGDPVAARLRGPGAGTFLGTAGALSPALRRRQHAGVQHHHARQLFPCAEAADPPQFPEAADRHDAEIAAPAQALRFAAGRHVRRRLVPARSPGARSRGAGRRYPARRAVHRQGVLRSPRGAGRARNPGRRPGPGGTALPVPQYLSRGRARPLFRRGGRLVPGGAA